MKKSVALVAALALTASVTAASAGGLNAVVVEAEPVVVTDAGSMGSLGGSGMIIGLLALLAIAAVATSGT